MGPGLESPRDDGRAKQRIAELVTAAAGMVCLLAIAFAVRAGASAPPRENPAVTRGRYLALGLCECMNCHSPLKNNGLEEPEPSMLGAGDVIDEDLRQVAPNLTPDPETGAGRWTDDQIVRAIREGVGHDGRRLSLSMPYDYYSAMTDDDARAMVAYLRSLPPVRHTLPPWRASDADEPAPEPLPPPTRPDEIATRIGRGGYLVRLARCGKCHTARPPTGSKRHRRLDMEFGGGRRFGYEDYFDELDPDPWFASAPPHGAKVRTERVVVSPNITSDPSGISYYDEATFIRTMRTGKVAGVRPLTRAMIWFVIGHLSDDDLGAIFAYLRSVPPVRHRVSNTDPPRWCPRCGRFHGLGELNEP